MSVETPTCSKYLLACLSTKKRMICWHIWTLFFAHISTHLSTSLLVSIDKDPHCLSQVIFRLISRHDNKEVPIKYRAATAFTFHFVNCHEEQGHLVVDFLGYSDFSVMDQLMVDDMSRSGMVNIVLPLFRRYVLPLSVDQVIYSAC